MHPINCVYLMWTFAKPGVYNEDLFNQTAERVIPEITSLDRCALAMFGWNYAFAGAEHDEVFQAISEETLREERMAELAPRDVAALTWAFAKAGKGEDRAVLEGLVQHSNGLLRDCIDQLCYRSPSKSLARPVYEEGDFSAVDGKVDAFDILSLADTHWAFAETQFVDEEYVKLSDEYLTEALALRGRQADRFLRYPQAFVKLLAARARLSPEGSQELFEAASHHILRYLPEIGMRDMAKLVWAWALLGPKDPWMLKRLDERFVEVLERMGTQSLSEEESANAVWALKSLGIGTRETIETLEQPPVSMDEGSEGY